MSGQNGKSILDTIGGLFGGKNNEQDNTNTAQGSSLMDSISGLLGSDVGKQLVSKLDGIKSFDPEEIQTVLGALSNSTDTHVQAAKQDLQASQHDGEAFVDKLKGYLTSLSQMLPAILPALQSVLGKK